MICLLCCFIFILSGLSMGAVMLCVFGIGFACNFFPLMAYLLEMSVSIIGIWSEIMVYVVCGFIEVIEALLRFGIHVAPYISHGCHHLYNSMPYIMNDLWHNVNNARLNIGNFIHNQREWLIYCWGLLLVPLYVFQNQVNEFLQGRRVNNQNRRRHNWQNYENDMNDDNVFDNRARENRHDNEEQNGRDRGQRLYPDLPNDADDDYVHVNNPPNDSQCIVCFDRDRNTAVFPCGHTQLCENCVRNVMRRNKRCPVCQRLIAEYRNIYL